MIRKSKQQDYEKLTKLWLEASLKAHDFIAADYWEQAADKIKTIYLPAAQTYVFEDKHQLKGFISLLDNNYIAALFVSRGHQKQRIGTKLLQYVRRRRPNMQLRVFVRNTNALRFYQKCGFKVVSEGTDTETQEKELLMAWAQGCFSGHVKIYKGDS